ncbi:MAG: coproporphyrinogen III oxidase, partial [Oscillatoriales cyanobacterium SM2_2_1]|nr:coproporphyrinogen III oxidase [Oscillatoriales cyanobacterium SM2_2_1]
VFFGGGTPSLLTASQIQQIMDTLRQQFPLSATAEISLEANPATFTRDQLWGYQGAGINRLSLGVQAFQDPLLDLCGRGHTVADIEGAIAEIRAAGITNLNLDLISGLPQQTLADWHETLHRAIAHQPEHISVYDLTIEPGTAFGKRYRPDHGPLPSEELTVTFYRHAHDLLTTHGYHHYEISNYARPGYLCQHNLRYWRNQDFYGVGMGATSYLQRQRCDRPRQLRAYETWVQHYPHPTPPLTTAEILFERFMEGLRLAEGLNLSQLTQEFPPAWVLAMGDRLHAFTPKGWVETQGDRVRLTIPNGWLFADTVIAALYDTYHGF